MKRIVSLLLLATLVVPLWALFMGMWRGGIIISSLVVAGRLSPLACWAV